METKLDTEKQDLKKEHSFVQDEMRPYAMKLHTRDQAPKEGQQKAETPFNQWEVSRANYLQFLVDSLRVYETFDKIIESEPRYSILRNTGLERSQALRKDIEWIVKYDTSLTIPPCGKNGLEYSKLIESLAISNPPKFICHYYNHYFAHTAGGRMIGKRMADKLLEGKTLSFYEWDGDVRILLDNVRKSIDSIAAGWTSAERQECLEETMATFRAGGSLMSYMKPPSSS
jgi:heme oxygenase